HRANSVVRRPVPPAGGAYFFSLLGMRRTPPGPARRPASAPAASREILEHRAGSGSRRVGPPSPIVPVSSGGREEPSPEFTVVHAWLDSRFGFGLVVTSAAAAPPARTGGGRRQLAPRPFRPLRPLHAFDPLRLIHLLDLHRLLDLLQLPPRMFRLVRFVLRHHVTVGLRPP